MTLNQGYMACPPPLHLVLVLELFACVMVCVEGGGGYRGCRWSGLQLHGGK
jgi:hypothetical protein